MPVLLEVHRVDDLVVPIVFVSIQIFRLSSVTRAVLSVVLV